MRKYWHVFTLGIQNTLVYRINFLFRATFGLVPLIAIILLWRAIYEGKGEGSDVGGYQLAQMISYYMIVTVVDALTAVTEDDWQIAREIREGKISEFLTKPIDYLHYRMCLYFSGRCVYTLVAAVPLSVFLYCYRDYLVYPSDIATLAWFGLSLSMTALLQFLISYTLALLAFWVLEVSTFILIFYAFEYIASGQLFPLDILPPMLHDIVQLTPFPYMLFFPVSIYLEKATGPELAKGLGMQLMWTLVAYGMARWLWRSGIRKYAAFGG